MHVTNQKLSFDIFTVQNIFMEHDLFWHKIKMHNFDSHNADFVLHLWLRMHSEVITLYYEEHASLNA